jgi:hypothetical protein
VQGLRGATPNYCPVATPCNEVKKAAVATEQADAAADMVLNVACNTMGLQGCKGQREGTRESLHLAFRHDDCVPGHTLAVRAPRETSWLKSTQAPPLSCVCSFRSSTASSSCVMHRCSCAIVPSSAAASSASFSCVDLHSQMGAVRGVIKALGCMGGLDAHTGQQEVMGSCVRCANASSMGPQDETGAMGLSSTQQAWWTKESLW